MLYRRVDAEDTLIGKMTAKGPNKVVSGIVIVQCIQIESSAVVLAQDYKGVGAP